MTGPDWIKEFPGAITVTDAQGIITEMNDRAAQVFAEDGGRNLIGRSVFDCHPEAARARLRELFERQESNVYTIEKGGVWKLVYQAPWYQEGRFAGLVELSLEIPPRMPHFRRGD